jgi:hypothetical protein
MGLFDFLFFQKKKQELKALRTEREGLGLRIAKANQRNYIVKMALVYEGKPTRYFEVIIKGKSKGNAAFLAQKDISLKVISAYLDRRKKLVIKK